MTDLSDLISRARSATGPDWRLSDDIHWALVNLPSGTAREHDGRRETNVAALWGGEDWRGIGPYFFGSADCTASLDAAVALCNRVLPGWWWRVGTCHVSDDATIGPDYNSPEHSERLHREFPIGVKDDGYPDEWIFDVDQRPPRSVALALILAVLLAKQEIDG